MGLLFSRQVTTEEHLQQLHEANSLTDNRLQALEVTLNQLRIEVNTLRAGKRKLEQQFEEFVSKAAQPPKRLKTTKLESANTTPVADATTPAGKIESGSPFPTSEKRVYTTSKKSASRQQHLDSPQQEQPASASKPTKDVEGTQGDKSHATSFPATDAVSQPESMAAAAPVRKRSARSSARGARSKGVTAVSPSPSTSAAASEKPSMTIAQMRNWLEEHGFAQDVEELSRGGTAKKAEWFALYIDKMALK